MKSKDQIAKDTKLLVLCQLFYPELISTGQTLTELCEVLSGMGIDIEVLAGPPTIVNRYQKVLKECTYKGIKIKRVWGTRFPKLSFIGKLINQITYTWSVFWKLIPDFSKRPILVLTDPPFLVMVCALLKKLGLGKPYIYLIFDVHPDTSIKLGLLKERHFLVKVWDWYNRLCLKNASAIIVIGRCMMDIIESKIKPGVLKNKIHFIPVWCNDILIQGTKRDENPYFTQWGLRNRFVVGYSGNMGRFHDLETIMEAARLLKDEHGIIFLFIGEGYKKQWAMEFAEKAGLKNCQFHTYVPRERLGYLLSLFDVGLVSLTEGQEGLSVPSKTFGLLTAGVPVIAIMSEFSEIARIIREEECGIVIKQGNSGQLANTINQLKKDKEKIAKMGKQGQKAIKDRYNLAAAAEKYYKLIKKLQY